MSDYDYVLKGGTVYDGTGAAPRRADVAVKDGMIAAVGETIDGPTIDVGGLAVAPGFIDIHTHYDAQVMWDRALTSSCWHGVTSAVMGNCGFSLAPCRVSDRELMFATLERAEDMRPATMRAGVTSDYETFGEYLGAIASAGTALNVGGYVGHTSVRMYVMGDEAYEREATLDEIDKMRAVVAASIEAGALGFSSTSNPGLLGAGGRPLPSVVGTRDELLALMRVPGEISMGINAISPGNDFGWIYPFQLETGANITWNSILTFPAGTAAFTSWDQKLAQHTEGRASGAKVWAQVTCRPIQQQITMRDPAPFSRAPAFRTLQQGSVEERIEAYRSAEWRSLAGDELASLQYVNPRWASFFVDESPTQPELIGRSIDELATSSGRPPLDVLLDITLRDDLATRFGVIFANDDERGVSTLIADPGCVLGLSDAGAHSGQICDANMPTDFLANWVRDRAVMPLEAGIRKLTGELADLYSFADRGYVAAGMRADLVTFDVDALAPGPVRRVTDLPAGGERLVADRPSGIGHVIVNGVTVVEAGALAVDLDGPLPGQTLRPAKRTA